MPHGDDDALRVNLDYRPSALIVGGADNWTLVGGYSHDDSIDLHFVVASPTNDTESAHVKIALPVSLDGDTLVVGAPTVV